MWGTLQGIRPTKIVHKLIKEGVNNTEIQNILATKYKISAEKSDLMMKVAEYEKLILDTNKSNEINIYVGIPFCPSKCIYCSFTSFSIHQKRTKVDSYLDALEKEIVQMSKAMSHLSIKSVYVGGGTPTSIDERQFERLLKIICENFTGYEEFTVEAGRPDTITKNKLASMANFGVDRISINPQSMNQRTLDIVGRSHNVSDVISVFEMAKTFPFKTINMDIIVGLPDEGVPQITHTLDEIGKLSPENITVHTLAIKTASDLKQDSDKYNLAKSKTISDMLDVCQNYMHTLNMKPYYLYRQKNMLGNFENVGYTKSGCECIYNVEIIEESQTILALGAGAASKFVRSDEIIRFANVKGVEEYIARVDEMIDKKISLLLPPSEKEA